MKVAYWTIRGLGAPCRMAAWYGGAGETTEFVNYDCVALEEGGWDRSSWFDVKPGLKVC